MKVICGYLFLILSVLLAGCATSPIAVARPGDIPPNEALVFGRADVVDTNKDDTVWKVLFEDDTVVRKVLFGYGCTIYIASENESAAVEYKSMREGVPYMRLDYVIIAPHEGSMLQKTGDLYARVVEYKLTDKGDFYWHLPPGRYRFLGFRNGFPMGSGITTFMTIEFDVPKETPAVYIGTYHNDLIALMMGKKGSISDDYDEALKLLSARLPDIKTTPVKSLMFNYQLNKAKESQPEK